VAATPITCIVVPTYNEKENVEKLVQGIEATQLPGLRVLFVDDGSADGTADKVRSMAASRPWVSLLERGGKLGMGSAYQEGFRTALNQVGASIIVEMDADLQHPASVIPLLVNAIREGADVAVGSRYVPGGGISRWSRLRRITSKGANAYSRFLLGLSVRDATSGFRAYGLDTAQKIVDAELPVKGYEFQVAALHLLKGQAKVVEVPYVFVERAAGRSKLKLGDRVRFFFAVLRILLSG